MTRILVGWTVVTSMVVIVGLSKVLPPPWVNSIYGSWVYPTLERILAPAMGSFSPSLSAVLLTALVPLAVTWSLLRIRRRPSRVLLVATASAAGVGAWFYLVWGFNYQRSPLEHLLPLSPKMEAEANLVPLAQALAALIAEEVSAEEDVGAAVSAIATSLEEITLSWTGSVISLPRRTKALPEGLLLTFGFAGVISPFLLEAHHDGGLPPAAVVAVGAHELAHIAGFAREAEAEFAAAVAGLRAGHPYARYAVALSQLDRILPALPRGVQAEVRDALPDRAIADLTHRRESAGRYLRPGLAGPLMAVYERYLRVQGVAGDYDRASLLLVRAWEAGLVQLGSGLE